MDLATGFLDLLVPDKVARGLPKVTDVSVSTPTELETTPALGVVARAASQGPSCLRLATWNLNHWRQSRVPVDTSQAAWAYLRDEIGADVALVQEAVAPRDLLAERVVYREIGGYRHWGSAVVALAEDLSVSPIVTVRRPYSRSHCPIEMSKPGSVAVACLEIPGIEPITLVSIYGVLDGSAVASMLRVVADLVPLFGSARGVRAIVTGDFNVSRTVSPEWIAGPEAVLGAVRALGLIEAKSLVEPPTPLGEACACRRGEGCDHVATWTTQELDYVFVSPALAGQVTALRAFPEAVERGLSDHVPLVLDLAPSAERTPHAWDEESFAEEIGRRHGIAARTVVERLVAWADERERLLGEQDGVRIRSLTRFPTNGVTTEPELAFPLDFNLAPRATQPTILIKASGEVVIPFAAMHLQPFDSASARHGLRRALNAIEGVDIPAWAVKGWPRFPLAILDDEAALGQFVAVLDRLVTESAAPDTKSAPADTEA